MKCKLRDDQGRKSLSQNDAYEALIDNCMAEMRQIIANQISKMDLRPIEIDN